MSTTETVTIMPTVGRNVYFNSPDAAHGHTECASIITAVKSEDVVSLVVFPPNGFYHVIDCERGQGANQWDWMPYQKEQALKHGAKVSTNEPLGEGDLVTYTDAAGNEHDGTVVKVWSQEMANIELRRNGAVFTSVPLKRSGMTGNYFKCVDKATERTDIPVEHTA